MVVPRTDQHHGTQISRTTEESHETTSKLPNENRKKQNEEYRLWTVTDQSTDSTGGSIAGKMVLNGDSTEFLLTLNHYENTPIQIYWKFYNQKRKIFR